MAAQLLQVPSAPCPPTHPADVLLSRHQDGLHGREPPPAPRAAGRGAGANVTNSTRFLRPPPASFLARVPEELVVPQQELRPGPGSRPPLLPHSHRGSPLPLGWARGLRSSWLTQFLLVSAQPDPVVGLGEAGSMAPSGRLLALVNATTEDHAIDQKDEDGQTEDAQKGIHAQL